MRLSFVDVIGFFFILVCWWVLFTLPITNDDIADLLGKAPIVKEEQNGRTNSNPWNGSNSIELHPSSD